MSGYSDQSAVIAEALKQYIQRRKQQEINYRTIWYN
ncbi:type II toxin-antitoxin system VapB family antitoxin [Anabaena sphaerica]|nr:type II toxin-antitoxin system VapB family antitoxin [Anabaena sphaerica]